MCVAQLDWCLSLEYLLYCIVSAQQCLSTALYIPTYVCAQPRTLEKLEAGSQVTLPASPPAHVALGILNCLYSVNKGESLVRRELTVSFYVQPARCN